GYRAGMDAVLLAAAIPAKEGERTLDVGAATGAAALCLAKRLPGVCASGIEIQESLVEIGRANIELNGLTREVTLTHGSLLDRPAPFPAASFDHVFANPPYFEHEQTLAPAAPAKSLAFVSKQASLGDWVDFMLAMAKPRGTVTFIFRAERVHDLLSLLVPRAGETVLFPLWPRKGKSAHLILVQARKGVHGASAVAPGLVLHGASNGYTRKAEGVLRGASALELWRCRHTPRLS
ncbi:MAG TPA: methyltransferase, partial [Sphingomonadales bacterium]|nr:methyltransferase [Sphingomonadales bacterium]